MTRCSAPRSSRTPRSFPAGTSRKSRPQTACARHAFYARRGPASAEFLAWLNVVEAVSRATIRRNTQEALRLVSHAKTVLAEGGDHHSPNWFTGLSPSGRPHSGATSSSRPGTLSQARLTLTGARQAASVADAQAADRHLRRSRRRRSRPGKPRSSWPVRREQALDQLTRTWYATGMDRRLQVRKALQPWAGHESLRGLMTASTGFCTHHSACSSIKRTDLCG